MKVIYPVLFYEESNGSYSVFVPDLEKELNVSASTCGSNLEEAMNRFVFLSKEFYARHREQQHIEIEQKQDRPYIHKVTQIH